MRAHEQQFPIRRLCQGMSVHPRGYYAWKASPIHFVPAKTSACWGTSSRPGWRVAVSMGTEVYDDLQAQGERCGKHRVARLMKQEGLRSQTGYFRRTGHCSGRPAVVVPNHLQRQFTVDGQNKVWVTDITYIRTHEGWLYLAVVHDLFSRQVIGWSMQSRIDRELVLNALLRAVWRRQPKQEVLVHSDQGSQFSRHDWQDFLKAHSLVPSMSRRGNCHDNAVAESFFQLLKRERIKRKTYHNREEARRDIFDYIEMFYNPKRRHGSANGLSPVEFEKHYFQRLTSV
ncbi:IS3 family transposase [Chromobacterium sp. Beijing]|uniref:IS3 family transposase n=1 Tax=Chromobacterium sp. Beijing TaxID=2735795 RepID=UPI001F343F67|nr:IS3 family transposase [Chromobacterium sp. Beijing]